MPRAVRVARSLWTIGFVLNGAAVFIAFITYDQLTERLTTTLGRLAPGYVEADLRGLVDVFYWMSIATIGLVIAAEALLLGFMLGRRGGARWVMLPVLAFHAVSAFVASAVLALDDWPGLIELLLLVGLALAAIGWFICIVPSANRWFRMKDESQRASLD